MEEETIPTAEVTEEPTTPIEEASPKTPEETPVVEETPITGEVIN